MYSNGLLKAVEKRDSVGVGAEARRGLYGALRWQLLEGETGDEGEGKGAE